MRKDVLALGLIISFVGLVSVAASQIVVKPEPLKNWKVVEEVSLQQAVYNVSVQGSLSQGDRFRVYFTLGRISGPLMEGATVLVNLTDPNGRSNLYDVSIGQVGTGGTLAITKPFPEGTANYTGTHKANAEGMGITLIYLALQKMEIKEEEPQYPYGTFFPVGSVIFLSGIGVLLLSSKIPGRKKRLHKSKRVL